MRIILPMAFCSLFIIAGVAIAGVGFRKMYKAAISTKWPTVTGCIASSELGRHSSDNGGTTYSADIDYEFTVNGITYRSNAVDFVSGSTSNLSAVQETINRYPKSRQVAVHYDPADPYSSVLEPGIHASNWLLLIFGFVFASFGSVFMLIVVKSAPKTAPVQDRAA